MIKLVSDISSRAFPTSLYLKEVFAADEVRRLSEAEHFPQDHAEAPDVRVRRVHVALQAFLENWFNIG